VSGIHYIQVEGVNLDPFILDTEDLSTIRGGGLLLLDAIHDVQKNFFNASDGEDVLSTGASVGLFRFKGDDEAADRVVRDIRRHLDAGYPHATILVDRVAATPDGFLRDRQRLTAKLRCAQLASPSLAVPDVHDTRAGGDAAAVCAFDQVRPASGQRWRLKGETVVLSPSTQVRRQYGVKQKAAFYSQVLQRDLKETLNGLDTARFALHFEQIAASRSWGPLNDKMAVLYLDGNSFSKIQNGLVRRACDGKTGPEADAAAIEALQSFDTEVKKYRARFLRTVLSDALDSNATAERAWRFRSRSDTGADQEADDDGPPDGRIRLETLLWGGDEIILVLPAWKGWAVASRFLTESKDWKIKGQDLTHALGLVFCQYKAPIHRVVALARALGDHAKAAVGRETSSLAYQVLESFDHVGAGVKGRFEGLCAPLGADPARLVLTPAGVDALGTAMPSLKTEGGVPQRQMKRLVRSLFVEKSVEKAEGARQDMAIDKTFRDATLTPLLDALTSGYPIPKPEGTPSEEEQEAAARRVEIHRLVAWYHIEQLWDYVAPRCNGEDRP
jgi:hypothetical protein